MMTWRERSIWGNNLPDLKDSTVERNRENYERCIRLVRQTLEGNELEPSDREWLEQSKLATHMRNTMTKLVYNTCSNSHKNRASIDTIVSRAQKLGDYTRRDIRKALRLFEKYFDGTDRHMTNIGYDWLDTQPELRNAVLDAVAVDADDIEVIRVILDWKQVWETYTKMMNYNAKLDAAGLFERHSW